VVLAAAAAVAGNLKFNGKLAGFYLNSIYSLKREIAPPFHKMFLFSEIFIFHYIKSAPNFFLKTVHFVSLYKRSEDCAVQCATSNGSCLDHMF
jgi:hypothetical protein